MAFTLVADSSLSRSPNWDDWLQSGYLTFDDGSTVTFAITHNDPGTASMVPLSQTYTTRSITLTVTAVAPSTQNVGLAEFRVYGSKCATCTSPTASYSASAPGATATDSAAATALHGTADASNNNLATFQTSDMAIDDVIGGYSGDPKIEWASIGEGVSAWLSLTWASSATVTLCLVMLLRVFLRRRNWRRSGYRCQGYTGSICGD